VALGGSPQRRARSRETRHYRSDRYAEDPCRFSVSQSLHDHEMEHRTLFHRKRGKGLDDFTDLNRVLLVR